MTTCPVASISYSEDNPEKATAIPVLYQAYFHIWMLKMLFALFVLNGIYLIWNKNELIPIVNILSVVVHGLFTFLHPSYALFLFMVMIVYRRWKTYSNPTEKLQFLLIGQIAAPTP